jgi:hypothetical protein
MLHQSSNNLLDETIKQLTVPSSSSSDIEQKVDDSSKNSSKTKINGFIFVNKKIHF